MNELLAVGASHKTAELPLRERIALTEAAHEPFLTGLLEDPAMPRRSCSRPATAPSSTSSSPTRWRRSPSVLGMLARRAGIRPTELVDAIYSLRNCDAARHLYRVSERPGLDDRRRGRGAGPGQARLRGGAGGAHHRPDDEPAVPRRARHRQARADRDRASPRAARASPRWRSTSPAARSATSQRAAC